MVLEHTVSYQEVVKSVADAGYKAIPGGGEGRQRSEKFRLSGLDCVDCAAKLEKKIRVLPGVLEAKVNFGSGKMTVLLQDTMEAGKIVKAVKEAGYEAEPDDEKKGYAGAAGLNNGKVILTALSGVFLAAGFMLSVIDFSDSPFSSPQC